MSVVRVAPQAGTRHASLKRKGLQVDSELVYAYAKTNNLAALEEFISGAHQANLGQVCSHTCLQHATDAPSAAKHGNLYGTAAPLFYVHGLVNCAQDCVPQPQPGPHGQHVALPSPA